MPMNSPRSSTQTAGLVQLSLCLLMANGCSLLNLIQNDTARTRDLRGVETNATLVEEPAGFRVRVAPKALDDEDEHVQSYGLGFRLCVIRDSDNRDDSRRTDIELLADTKVVAKSYELFGLPNQGVNCIEREYETLTLPDGPGEYTLKVSIEGRFIAGAHAPTSIFTHPVCIVKVDSTDGSSLALDHTPYLREARLYFGGKDAGLDLTLPTPLAQEKTRVDFILGRDGQTLGQVTQELASRNACPGRGGNFHTQGGDDRRMHRTQVAKVAVAARLRGAGPTAICGERQGAVGRDGPGARSGAHPCSVLLWVH